MKTQTVKKLFTLHSWFGLATAWLLFVISFSGVVALFAKDELRAWSQPQLPVSYQVDGTRVEQLVEQYQQQVPEPYQHNVHIYPSARSRHGQLVILFEAHDGDGVFEKEAVWAFHFDPQSYELQESVNKTTADYYGVYYTNMPNFLAGFHADLHLGNPIGLMITGAIGLLLLVSVVTGTVIHRQLIRQAFTMRWLKSVDIRWRDVHKLMGVWGLAFNFIIGFTGAFLGLAAVALLPAAALVKFQGDTGKLIETFVEYPEPALSHQYKATPLQNILTDVHNRLGDGEVYSITILHPGDSNGDVYVEVGGGPDVVRQMMKYDIGSETLIKSFSRYGDFDAAATPVLDLMSPLHFGHFGGLPIKLLWMVLGLTSALLPLSGMLIWLYKQHAKTANKGESLLTSGYQLNLRLTLAVSMGLVFATLAIFVGQTTLYNQGSGALVDQWVGPLFFMVWGAYLLLCLMPFALTKLVYQSVDGVIVMLALVAMTHLYYYPQQVFQLSDTTMLISLSINGLLLAIAALLIYLRYKGPLSTRQSSRIEPGNYSVKEN